MSDRDAAHDVDRFTWERCLRASGDVIGTRLCVLLVLGSHMSNDAATKGQAFPSQAKLAEEAGLRERIVRQHLASAVADGWLEVLRRGGRRGDGSTVSSLYQARTPHLEELGSTGTVVPIEGKLKRHDRAGSAPLNRHGSTPQPARIDTSTGTTVPPNSLEQVKEQEGEESPLDRVAAFLGPMNAENRAKDRRTLRAALDRFRADHSSRALGDAIARLELAGVRSDYPAGPYAREIKAALEAELATATAVALEYTEDRKTLRANCATCAGDGHLLDALGHSLGPCPDCLGATSERVDELLERSTS